MGMEKAKAEVGLGCGAREETGEASGRQGSKEPKPKKRILAAIYSLVGCRYSNLREMSSPRAGKKCRKVAHHDVLMF